MDDFDYLDYVTALPGGSKRRANVEMLFTRASDFEKTSYFGLFHFVRYIEQLEKYDVDYGEAGLLDENADVVRIMSIHKSKGLEFPIVILAGMGKKFNKQDAYGRLLIDPDFGVGADFLDLDMRLKSVTLKKQVLKRRLELEGLGEELRVLYVAMTRAKEKLVMTGTDPRLESKLEKQGLMADGPIPYTMLTGAGSYLDWMLMSLPKAGEVIDVRILPVASFIGQEVVGQMEKQSLREMLLEKAGKSGWDLEYGKRLEEALKYVYPYQEDVSLYAMMSVSELKRRSQE